MRKRAKAVNFGIVYGISGFSLAKDIGTTTKEASQYIKNYLYNYPSIDAYLENVVNEASENGYTKTPMGKATGASSEKLQLGNLRYLIHKIANASGRQKFLLQVRLSAELEFWMLRKYKYHYGSLKQALDINNREVKKICIIAILLFPISLTITLAKIILSRI
jgi:hypothetical protein